MSEAQRKHSASYSNSAHDIHSDDGRTADEGSTRNMYEQSPYPDLGADLKSMNTYLRHLPDDFKKQKLSVLDAGCGTGHIVVGMAKDYPHWDCYGVDLSNASLEVAQQLADKHNTENVTLERESYLDPLPFDKKFDLISAIGTFHHCADPVKAMTMMKKVLNPNGYLLLHMYGWRADSGKFDVKNMLNILEPDITNHESRFKYYRALQEHKNKKILKKILNMSIMDLYHATWVKWRNLKRRMNKVSWSPPWYNDYKELNSPWVDHFCHPCERAYEVPEIQELIEQSGYEVVKMITQGKEFPQLIPGEWKNRYAQLNEWEKYRLSELLAHGGGSFAMVLKAAD